MREKLDPKQYPVSKITSGNRLKINIIKKICGEKYSNQLFYGNAALNRLILLDSDIAELLTPEVIISIFILHNNTETLTDKNPIALKRNSGGLISLAAAIFHGFNDGLAVLELMPNNEENYNPKEYAQQKSNFQKNSLKIVDNIRKAAKLLAIDLDNFLNAKENKPVDDNLLFEKYKKIQSIIEKIKLSNDEKSLVAVPGYTCEDIKNQFVYGFLRICDLLNISYKIQPKKKEIRLDVHSLELFSKKFVSSDAILLDGIVIHLFYDRVHLEAGMLLDAQIYFGDALYTFKDIFADMISHCGKYETAREQFSVRLTLVENHLLNFTPSLCQKYGLTSQDLILMHERFQDKPLAYQKFSLSIVQLNNKINHCKWVLEDSEANFFLKFFLQHVVDKYDKEKGKMSFSECFKFSKEDISSVFDFIYQEDGFKVMQLYALLGEKPRSFTLGPRNKNRATYKLEKLVSMLLDPDLIPEASYNVLNELEIKFGDLVINVTLLLEHKPDFEHFEFSDQVLNNYVNFILKKAVEQPTLKINGQLKVPTREDYSQLDQQGVCSHLHYASKLAISLYTNFFYITMQDFLRNNGKKTTSTQDLKKEKLTSFVKEAILAICIASYGIAKQPPNKLLDQSEILLRIEKVTPEDDFFNS